MLLTENQVYKWSKTDVTILGIETGGGATIEASFNGADFSPVCTLPLESGDLFVQVQLRDMYFRVTQTSGAVHSTVRPAVIEG